MRRAVLFEIEIERFAGILSGSTMDAIYLDHAATTTLDARVREAMLEWLGPKFGNASSRHPFGLAARAAIERSRSALALTLAVRPNHVVFTSGATEANNLGVLGAARALRGRGTRVLIGPTEHPSVREAALALAAEGFQVESLRLDREGALDLADAERRLGPDVILVAQMLVSNEFGTVYPVRELARLVRVRAPRARVHVDAVQAFGKLDCAPGELGADSIALSGHKFHGPQGSGALVNVGGELAPLAHGGGQEKGARPGTENVAAIVGLGAAATIADSQRADTLAAAARARALLVEAVERIPGARVLAPGRAHESALDTILAVVLGVPAEVAMHHMEAQGVMVSAGAACQSRKDTISPSFEALGLTADEARRTLRFSFARTTTEADARRAGEALTAVHQRLIELAS